MATLRDIYLKFDFFHYKNIWDIVLYLSAKKNNVKYTQTDVASNTYETGRTYGAAIIVR